MKTAHVCFLWHMHQPYYTDPVTRTVGMPWVRLHASKAYFDMAFLLERFPDIRSTFNFTPSLLLQLNEAVSGSVADLFLEYATRSATDLSPGERAFLLRHFFAANWANMVRPFPRYHELLVKRGVDGRHQDWTCLEKDFTTQDWRDLQIWHNLAWFGYGAVARYPRLAALRQKDRGFTEENKHEVLAIQRQVVSDIIPMYRALAARGQIELTTTPFYHPILPLVIDTDIGRRARPDSALPSRLQATADAEAQLQRAVAYHTAQFGRAPHGLWPSEGSVCPEMIPLVRQAGFNWMATDEGILARSLGHWNRQADLFRPYLAGPSGQDTAQDIKMVFRDREMSDAFGFVYSKWTAESAIEDVLCRVAANVEHATSDQILIPIILDGENPWEHYFDGGERFLSGLYNALSTGTLDTAERRVSSQTISHALEQSPPTARLSHLHSGSWINSDFKIWIGHAEDNRGWDMVRETRARLVEMEPTLTTDQAAAAWEALYAAEGSDWFWWYGDDFHTEYKLEFDRLFRTHLRNVFLRAGKIAPEFLNHSVIDPGTLSGVQSVRLPIRLISPTIDGMVTDFFEWRGAGLIDPSPPHGAMWKASDRLSHLAFGYSLEALFLRVDVKAPPAHTPVTAEWHVRTPSSHYKATFPLSTTGLDHFILWSSSAEAFQQVGRYTTIASQRIIELAIPFKDLALQAGQDFSVSLILSQEELEIERYPRHHAVSLTVPDRNFEARMWRV
jgi:alpha-amylase/alpha-mannosidase (GH57 family)